MPGPLVGLAAGLAIFPALGAASEPWVEGIRQASWRTLPMGLLTPENYALAARRNLLPYDTLQEMAQRKGLNDSQFRLLTELQRAYLSPMDLITLARREVVGKNEIDSKLRELGYEDQDVEHLHTLSLIIPPVNDLITMAVKGAFSQQEIEQFKTLEQFPEDVAAWAAKQGLSVEWAKRYWSAHWQLPSPQQVFEMLQRGAIDDSVLDIYLRAADYSVFWRDALKKISYNPLTRVDLRRMDKLGTIDDTRLLRGYRDIGYNAGDAKLLFDFTKAFNHQEKKIELKDLTDGLRASIVTGVVNGTYSESDGAFYLKDIGYADAEVDSFFALARHLRNEKINTRILERLGDLYVKSRAEETEVRAYMVKRGFTEAETALRLEEWGIERELRAPSEQAEKDRDLTKAEIIAAFKDGIMSEEETRSQLASLKYDPDEIETLINLAQHDIDKVVQKDEIEVVKNGFLALRITENEAVSKLDALGLRSSQRNALVSSWVRSVETRSFSLPLSMVEAMFTRAIRTEEETRIGLQQLGANERDARDILVLWGAKGAEKKLREDRAAAKKKGVASA